jgi:DNA-binding helix-hairpin-helix protein with protein kinase domain
MTDASQSYWLLLKYERGQRIRKIPLALGSMIGSGGTARVYRVDNAPVPTAAKIYADTGLGLASSRARLFAKLRMMTDHFARLSEALPFVAWPEHLIVTACCAAQPEGTICGFTMPNFSNTRSLECFFHREAEALKPPAGIDLYARTRAAIKLCGKIARLHARDIHVADLSGRNIHVSPSLGNVYLIDADGYQISIACDTDDEPIVYPITGTSYGYRSRRLAIAHYMADTYPIVSNEDDQTALAIIVFQLLTGHHPFATGPRYEPIPGAPRPFNEDNMMSGRFPYQDLSDKYDLDASAVDAWRQLSPALQAAFTQAMTFDPLPPSAWIELLSDYKAALNIGC